MRKNLKKKISRFALAAALISLAALSYQALSQETEIRPVTVGQPMPDFTLPAYQGDNLSLSSLKGKNVLLVFPRGFAAQARWCTIDNYYYAELVDLDKSEQVRKKYNAEIIYVFPYGKETVKEWVASNPDQLEKIETWKNPAEPEKLDDQGKARMERTRKSFPKSLKMKKDEVPTPFPILIDAERKVSNGLGIFSMEWGGSKVDQCISSVFILDKKGILQFKYIGQNTMDRPSSEYLMKTLERINKGE